MQYRDIPHMKASKGGPTAKPASDMAYGILRNPGGSGVRIRDTSSFIMKV